MNCHPLSATTAKSVDATFQEVWRTLIRSLDHLLQDNHAENGHLERLDLVESLLHSLPLASGEYGLAVNRTRNARRYYQAREIGAARYELRLLACSLRYTLNYQQPVEPRRRLRSPTLERAELASQGE